MSPAAGRGRPYLESDLQAPRILSSQSRDALSLFPGAGFGISSACEEGRTGHLSLQVEDLETREASQNILAPLSFVSYQGHGPLFPEANRRPFNTPSLIGSLGLALGPSLPPLLCFVPWMEKDPHPLPRSSSSSSFPSSMLLDVSSLLG